VDNRNSYYKELTFLRSALTEKNPFMKTGDCIEWLEERRRKTHVQIRKIPFHELRKWYFDENGNLRHDSGRFFSIEGIHVQTNCGTVPEWSQPIINQPEIGILGIITRQIDGILYFLMQAKIEPGNINYVQLSPTLQATKSNYTKVHEGKAPDYLEYFLDSSKSRVLLDQLQSEQGARFLATYSKPLLQGCLSIWGDNNKVVFLKCGSDFDVCRVISECRLTNSQSAYFLSSGYS